MMSWRPIDFQGIVGLKSSVIDQLEIFLNDKESQLANQIVEAIKYDEREEKPLLPPIPTSILRLRLSEAIEITNKRIKQLGISKKVIEPPEVWEQIGGEINHSLWNYVESLESTVTELFQQIDQMGIEQWRPNLIHVIDEIKVLLMHSLDDGVWTIRRLEELLRDFRSLCKTKNTRKPWETVLDKDLINNLEQTKKYLSSRYQTFSSDFTKYHEMNEEVIKSSQKLGTFHVMSILDAEAKHKFGRLYELLKMWQKNRKSKALPAEDTMFAIRSLVSFERAHIIFKDYYNMLRLVLFERSRNLKTNPQELFVDAIGKNILLEVIDGFKEENKSLEAVVRDYREFLLETDPNPKVRSRWKIAGWVNAEEPHQPKVLQGLLYDLESLDVKFNQLRQGVVKGPDSQTDRYLAEEMQQTQKWLHEMGQPLVSKSSLRLLGEKVIGSLQKLDELGSFHQHVSDFTGDTLSKALRSDWKYQVLLDIPEFYNVYSIHQGMAYLFEDRQHTARLNKFKRLIQKIDEWMKKKTYPRHIHEVESDLSDIKGYLQDFLGQVQRFANDNSKITDNREYSEQVRELYRQLLEYRYLFGAFFHELSEEDIEERNIRNQFLFVDQYFETVDNKLQEIRALRPFE